MGHPPPLWTICDGVLPHLPTLPAVFCTFFTESLCWSPHPWRDLKKRCYCQYSLNLCNFFFCSIGKLRTFSCWKASQCNVNEIADSFLLDNFEFFCCQHDLCNESAITGVNKAAFSIASLMAMLWMFL
uniref:Membrane attack complex inhibition factor n=1 Tax=Taeniopygia guttata TaxID=59729 RepID=A0A674H6K9_TAEGU